MDASRRLQVLLVYALRLRYEVLDVVDRRGLRGAGHRALLHLDDRGEFGDAELLDHLAVSVAVDEGDLLAALLRIRLGLDLELDLVLVDARGDERDYLFGLDEDRVEVELLGDVGVGGHSGDSAVSGRGDDLAEELDMDLPEDSDYDTVGGMIFSCLHTIPADGTQFDVTVNGLEIHVEKIEDRRIEEALIKKLLPAEDGDNTDSEDNKKEKKE